VGEHTEPLTAVGVLNGTYLTVTTGRTLPAAVPAHYWRRTDGVTVAGGLRQHTVGRP
jgi:hypothetical protein